MAETTEEHIGVPLLLILGGVAGILFNLYYQHDRFYLNEDLSGDLLVLREVPAFVNPYRGDKHYLLKTTTHRCDFWISRGALDVVDDDPSVEKQVKDLKAGDEVRVLYRNADDELLNNFGAAVRVIELRKGSDVLIPKEQVYRSDKKSFLINMGLSVALLILGVFIWVRKKMSQNNMGASDLT